MTKLLPISRRIPSDRASSGAQEVSGSCGATARFVLAILLGCGVPLVAAPAAIAAGSGSISGEVTEAKSKMGLANVAVGVLSESGEPVEVGFTEAGGKYTVSGLAAGSYRVEFIDLENENLIRQFYPNAYTFAGATSVTVKEGAVTENINDELREGGTITGTVESPTKPLPNAEVVVFGTVEGKLYFMEAETQESGTYSLSGLPPGSYQVAFFPPSAPSSSNLIPQYYNEAPSLIFAKKIEVEEEHRYEKINAKLREGGEISGTVTDAATRAPLAEVCVYAKNLSGSGFFGGEAVTATNGKYAIHGLEQASYKLEFEYCPERPGVQYKTLSVSPVTVLSPLATGLNVALERDAPVNTVGPQLTGTPVVGQPLFCTTGSWTGVQPITFTYAWLRDGTVISGAAGSTYFLQPADQGHEVTCRITAQNSSGRVILTLKGLNVPAAPASSSFSSSSSPPPPKLENVTQSHSTWREGNKLATFSRKQKAPVGTTFSFVLNEDASVSLSFKQNVAGRKVHGKCVVQTNSNRKKPSCKRTVIAGTVSFSGHTGLNKVAFQGRVSPSKRLASGTYALVITATTATGQSAKAQLNFTIVK